MRNTYSGWHVLYVKSQHEKKVDLMLKEFELDSFLPTVSTFRQWADRKKKVVKPLFPSYVFLNVRSKSEFNKALGIRGVYKYIQFGDHYAKVKEKDIYRIKQFLNMDGISEIDTGSIFPNVGEKMMINYGALKGLICMVIRVNNKNRILVNIESLRQNLTAVIPINFLSKI